MITGRLAIMMMLLVAVPASFAQESVTTVIPQRTIPPLTTVSPKLQRVLAQRRFIPIGPVTTDEWLKFLQNPDWVAARKKALATANEMSVDQFRARINQNRIALQKRYAVSVEPRVIAGVNCFIITPNSIPPENRNRLLVNVHGGRYINGAGIDGTTEAIRIAGFTHIKTIAIDYRMPPRFPYPAAMDDAMAVWREAVNMDKPANMAIFGTSAGGGITLAMVQRAKEERVPLPAAIMAGTPWSDLSKTGDTYFTNANVDTVLRAYEGSLGAAALLYANGRDLKDPHLSPVYGSFDGFPPTITISGTRDLFLSNTVRVEQKLLEAGVETQLLVFEGQSHSDYYADDDAPETLLALKQIKAFFEKHLGE